MTRTPLLDRIQERKQGRRSAAERSAARPGTREGSGKAVPVPLPTSGPALTWQEAMPRRWPASDRTGL